MPTASEASSAEAARWSELASHWTREAVPEIHADRPPAERELVVFYDPREDLSRRARNWSHHLSDHTLPSLALFAAGLADMEAGSWSANAADVATRAYESRRFLLGDRVIHWAVPWLDVVGRCYPEYRDTAHSDRDFLLLLADEMRVSPVTPGREGLVVDGEDSYGPIRAQASHPDWLTSLWSGHLLLQTTLRRLGGISPEEAPPHPSELDQGDLALLYEAVVQRWLGLSDAHPGSAQIWIDLSERAAATAAGL